MAFIVLFFCAAAGVGCSFWPVIDDSLLKWSLNELVAFLCDLENDWTISDSGRFTESSRLLPGGYFNFSFPMKAHEQLRYSNCISLSVSRKGTHCFVELTRDLVPNLPDGWLLATCDLERAQPVREDSILGSESGDGTDQSAISVRYNCKELTSPSRAVTCR
jgi:hypothetical protein